LLQKEGIKNIVRKSHSVRGLESKEPTQEVAYIYLGPKIPKILHFS
jgi:hypothetical protein